MSSGTNMPQTRRRTPHRASIRAGLLVAKIAVTSAALYLVLRSVELETIKGRMHDIDLLLFLGTVAVFLMQIVLVSVRWMLVLERLHGSRPISIIDALAITMSGQFVNQFMPTAAGEAARAALIARTGVSVRVSITSVLVDRGLAVLVLLVIAGPPLVLSEFATLLPGPSRTLLVLTALLLVGFLIVLKTSPVLVRLLAPYPMAKPVAAALEDMRLVVLSWRTSVPAAALSLVVHALSVMILWILSYAIGVPMSILTVWALIPPMLLATMLPFTIGGWGAREGVVVGFLAATGVPSDAALLLSLSFGVALLLSALPGAITWLRFFRQND